MDRMHVAFGIAVVVAAGCGARSAGPSSTIITSTNVAPAPAPASPSPSPSLDAQVVPAATVAPCSGSDEAVVIDDALDRDARKAGPWNIGWGVTFAVAAVGQGAVAGLAGDRISDNQRVALWIGAGKAAIGALARVVRPLSIDRAPDCADPATQRKALSVAHRRERNNMLLNLFGGLALNTGGLLYLGIERGAWREGAMSFAVGTAVGLVSLYTAPRRSFHLQRRLDRGESVDGLMVAPMIGNGTRGVAFGWSW